MYDADSDQWLQKSIPLPILAGRLFVSSLFQPLQASQGTYPSAQHSMISRVSPEYYQGALHIHLPWAPENGFVGMEGDSPSGRGGEHFI